MHIKTSVTANGKICFVLLVKFFQWSNNAIEKEDKPDHGFSFPFCHPAVLDGNSLRNILIPLNWSAIGAPNCGGCSFAPSSTGNYHSHPFKLKIASFSWEFSRPTNRRFLMIVQFWQFVHKCYLSARFFHLPRPVFGIET
jgi:hypothetical protein